MNQCGSAQPEAQLEAEILKTPGAAVTATATRVANVLGLATSTSVSLKTQRSKATISKSIPVPQNKSLFQFMTTDWTLFGVVL
jgi:hypothetical protein